MSTTTVNEPTAVVRRFIDEVVNSGRFELIDELWAPEMVWRGGSLGEIEGIDAYKAFLTANASGAFSEMFLTVDQITSTGDTVWVSFTNSAVHSGEFMGTAATGRHAKWTGTGIYTVQDGKIVSGTFVEDILGMLLQLGVTTLPAI
jgi:predicted ester cyclase